MALRSPQIGFTPIVLMLAPFWSAYGMVDQAENYLQAAIKIAEASDAQGKLAELYLAASYVEQTKGNLTLSEDYTNKAQSLLPSDDAGKALMITILMRRGELQRISNQPEIARTTWQEALELAVQLKKVGEQSTLYNHLGTLEIAEFHNAETAKTLFDQSLIAARQSKNDYIISHALQQLGLLESQVFRNFEQAKVYLDESLKLARGTGNAERTSATLQALGWLEGSQNNLERSRDYYEEALVKARISKSVQAIGWGAFTLANIVISLGQCSRAETLIAESLRQALIIENDMLMSFIVDILIKCGATRLVLQELRYDTAIWDSIQAMAHNPDYQIRNTAWLDEVRDQLDNPPAQPVWQGQQHLGRLEGDEFRDYGQAAIHFGESLKIAEELKDPALIFASLLKLAQVNTELGDFAAAEQYLTRSLDHRAAVSDSSAQISQQLLAIGRARIEQQAVVSDFTLWDQVVGLAEGTEDHPALVEVIQQLRELNSSV